MAKKIIIQAVFQAVTGAAKNGAGQLAAAYAPVARQASIADTATMALGNSASSSGSIGSAGVSQIGAALSRTTQEANAAQPAIAAATNAGGNSQAAASISNTAASLATIPGPAGTAASAIASIGNAAESAAASTGAASDTTASAIGTMAGAAETAGSSMYSIGTAAQDTAAAAASPLQSISNNVSRIGAQADMASSELGALPRSAAAAGNGMSASLSRLNPLNWARRARTDLAGIKPPIDAATHSANRFGDVGSSGINRVSSAAGGLVSKLAAAAAAYMGINAIAGALKSAINDQVVLESNTLAMGSLINANFTFPGMDNFAASMQVSQGFVKDLAKDATQLPGQFADFVSIAKAISGPLFNAGGNMETLRQKTGQIAVLSSVMGIRTEEAGNMLSRMLQGQSGADNPIAMFLKSTGALKLDFEELNKLDPAARMAKIFAAVETIAGSEDMLAAVAGSAAVQFSTLQDNFFGVLGIMGQAADRIMPRLVAQAARVNQWFADNPDKVTAMADTISSMVIPLIEGGADLLLYAMENAEGIKVALIAAAAAAASIKIAGMVAPGGLSGISGFGSKLQSIPLPTPTITLTGASLSSLAGGLPAIMPMITAQLAALGPLLVPITVGLVAIVGIVGAVIGVIAVVRSNLFGLGDLFMSSTGGLLDSLMELGSTLGGVFLAAAVPLGVILVPAISLTAWVLGKLIDFIVFSINQVGGQIAGFAAFLGAIIANPFDIGGAMKIAAEEAMNFNFKDLAKDLTAAAQKEETKTEETKQTVNGLQTSSSTTNVGTININQKFEKDVSPDRIAFGVFDTIDNLRARAKPVEMRPLPTA